MADLVASGTNAHLKLEEFLPYRLAVLSDSVSRGLAQIHERFGLGWGEWHLLMTLGEAGTITASAFGARNGMHKTRVSRAVAVLLKRGLIVRAVSQTDMRQALLRLTPPGKDICDQIAPLAREYLNRLEDGLTLEDRAALDRALARIVEKSRRLMLDSFPRIAPAHGGNGP